jgi:hypothetical protein
MTTETPKKTIREMTKDSSPWCEKYRPSEFQTAKKMLNAEECLSKE